MTVFRRDVHPCYVVLLLCLVVCALFAFTATRSIDCPATTHTQNLSAYYQCFDRTRAAEEVLKRFRSFYPYSEIIMVNDGGNKALSFLAMEYSAKYLYSDRTSSEDHGMYFSSWKKGAVYIERIIQASKNCDWLILLEDDVWLLSNIPLQTMCFDINGAHSWLLLPECLMDVVRARNPSLQKSGRMQYAGNGGSVLRCSFFNGLNNVNWKQDLPSLFIARDGYLASDEMLSSLTYIYGGSIGPYYSFCQPNYLTFLFKYMTGSISVLHEVKVLY